jgi:DNA-binding transcriptional LysR family regulator
MLPALDIDLLRSFIAIAETGSFTRAAIEVNKTQSAVSMQMRRLEDMTGRPLFARDGRNMRLTQDGSRLLDHARRLTQLNDEAMSAFIQPALSGTVRLGTPDDYADIMLPGILARFAKSHPLVRVDVECEPSSTLLGRTQRGEIDLSIITVDCDLSQAQILRREALIWATSEQHRTEEQEILPLAISQDGCPWFDLAIGALQGWNRQYRIAYSTQSATVTTTAVLAGLAVAVLPRMLLRPGMRELDSSDGFPPLGEFNLGLVYASQKKSPAIRALGDHIAANLRAPGPLRSQYA